MTPAHLGSTTTLRALHALLSGDAVAETHVTEWGVTLRVRWLGGATVEVTAPSLARAVRGVAQIVGRSDVVDALDSEQALAH